MLQALRIEDYRVFVKLGCEAEERAVPQEVLFTVEVRFAHPPTGASTDEIDDTICYADLCDILKRTCEGREFRLIEKLGHEAHLALRELIAAGDQIGVKVHKVRPPIENLIGGSQYRLGDFLP